MTFLLRARYSMQPSGGAPCCDLRSAIPLKKTRRAIRKTSNKEGEAKTIRPIIFLLLLIRQPARPRPPGVRGGPRGMRWCCVVEAEGTSAPPAACHSQHPAQHQLLPARPARRPCVVRRSITGRPGPGPRRGGGACRHHHHRPRPQPHCAPAAGAAAARLAKYKQ